ncbi:HAD hydrolase-like protein [Streptomyces sp. NPDC048489]|uniref:HAD family hydrolase n=1 Tax=Streptomyces sp. NPDC048489 TaxID=3154504 RepID=UPI00343580AE
MSLSGEVRARKPERRLFEAAAAECGALLSAGGWMVGDNPETDMDGARAAGLRTLWVANGREWADVARQVDGLIWKPEADRWDGDDGAAGKRVS